MNHAHDHDHKHQHNTNTLPRAGVALNPANHSLKDYVPLIVVFAFVTVASATHVYVTGNTFVNWMMAIMGYFFLFFALFKFIDLPGFAEGYAHYDILAKKVRAWGFLYPFIELVVGVLYLANIQEPWLYILTIVITLLNVISVSTKLARKEKFMCACLGTVLKVPLTTVTLIEYGLMGAMAFAMLFL